MTSDEERIAKEIATYIRKQIPEYPDGKASRMGLASLAANVEEGKWKPQDRSTSKWGIWCECNPPETIMERGREVPVRDDGRYVRPGFRGWLATEREGGQQQAVFDSESEAERYAASLRSDLIPTCWWTYTPKRRARRAKRNDR